MNWYNLIAAFFCINLYHLVKLNLKLLHLAPELSLLVRSSWRKLH